MKIPVWILSTLVMAALAVEGWTLDKVITIGEDVAGIKATLSAQSSSQSVPVYSQPAKVAENKP